MRRRAYTSSLNVQKSQQPKFLREQYQKTKIQLSILTQKYESLEKQRDILKQGNSNLVQQFLFNRHRQQLNRLQRQVKQKTQQNTELKRIIGQLDEMVKLALDKGKQGNKNSKSKYQSIRKFSIKVENNKDIIANKQSSIGHELKIDIKDLIDSYQKLLNNGRLYKSTLNQSFKVNKNSQKGINFSQSQIVTPSYEMQQLTQQKTQQLNTKINQLTLQNRGLKQKIQQLTLELMNFNNEKKNSLDQLSLQRQKNTNTIFNLNDYQIPMSTSQSHTDQLQKSIIYDKFSQSSFMQQSIVTQSYDKRINKLQKTNSILQKDYQLSKDKIKSLNRQYSKLKLDFLKLDQDKRRLQETHQRKISSMNDKVQALNKKIKDLQLMNQKTKSQKNKQKQSHKNLISQHQSKIIQLQQKIQKNNIEISHLNQQLELSKKQQQKQFTIVKQLQLEKQKSKQLEKQLQQRSTNFQKSLKNYETIIQEMRKMNKNTTQKQTKNLQKHNKGRSRSRESSATNKNKTSLGSSFISPSQSSLLMTLRQQISLLQSTITTQNERYNILQNSNKELRQRLIRMIENEERLRKQLINQRIKTRTNKSISQSSKYSQKARSVLKRSFNDGNDNHNFENYDSQFDDGQQFQSGSSETRLDELKIQTVQKQNLSSLIIATERNSQSYINPLNNKTLKQSNSNRQFKSQSIIVVDNQNINDGRRININNTNSGSQMKMLRQRRFDPKETLVTKKKQIFQNKIHQGQGYFKVTQNIDKPQSPVDGFKSLVDNQEHKQIVPQKLTYKNKFQYQNYQPTYGKSALEKRDSKIQQKQSPNKSSPKYVYQPPKPKGLSPKPFNPTQSSFSNSPLIPTSQPPTDNKQISFQISESQSNLSKGDKIIELLSMNNESKIDDSPFVNPFGQNMTVSKPVGVRQQPVSVGRFADLEVDKKQANNIVMSGRTQQQTKSSAQVRFSRKY